MEGREREKSGRGRKMRNEQRRDPREKESEKYFILILVDVNATCQDN